MCPGSLLSSLLLPSQEQGERGSPALEKEESITMTIHPPETLETASLLCALALKRPGMPDSHGARGPPPAKKKKMPTSASRAGPESHS